MQVVLLWWSVAKGRRDIGDASVCRGATMKTATEKPNPPQIEKTKIVTREILREKLLVDETCIHKLHGSFVQPLNHLPYIHLTFGHFRGCHKDNDVNNIIELTILLRHCTY